MSTLAFVDIETTGLDVDRAEVWEVGLYIESTYPSEGSSDDGEVLAGFCPSRTSVPPSPKLSS